MEENRLFLDFFSSEIVTKATTIQREIPEKRRQEGPWALSVQRAPGVGESTLGISSTATLLGGVRPPLPIHVGLVFFFLFSNVLDPFQVSKYVYCCLLKVDLSQQSNL